MTSIELDNNDRLLEEIVNDLYMRICCDAALIGFFRDVDFKKLKGHQKQILRLVLSNRDMKRMENTMIRIHKRLVKQGLSTQHFDKFTEHIFGSLLAAGIGEPDAETAVMKIATLKHCFGQN